MLDSSDSAASRVAHGQRQNAAGSSEAEPGMGSQMPAPQDLPEPGNLPLRHSAACHGAPSIVGARPRAGRQRHLHGTCSQSGDSDDAATALSSFVRRWTLRGARFCPRNNSNRPTSEPSSPAYLASRGSSHSPASPSSGGTSQTSPDSMHSGDNEAEDGARFVLAVYRSGQGEQPGLTSTNMPAVASAAANGEARSRDQPQDLTSTNMLEVPSAAASGEAGAALQPRPSVQHQ